MPALKLLTIVGSAAFFAAGIVASGWVYEMNYTHIRQESYEQANRAMYRGEPNPNKHIIRPPVEDRSYYK